VQGGQETDFILVSCSGAGIPNESRVKVLRAKQVYSASVNASFNIHYFPEDLGSWIWLEVRS
jgi:hypothetical protein